MSEQTGGEAVVATLRALGVEHAFGIVSVHNLPIFDAVQRRDDIAIVPTRHEQAAVHAADGYARVTGGLGVAITSTGPGAGNAMGGLVEAFTASSRVLMITGQVESAYYGKGQGYLHEAEHQLDMLRAVTRRSETVTRREDIPEVLRFVVADIVNGRARPGAVEIPIDLQYARAPEAAQHGVDPAPVVPDEGALDRAWEVLREARRPLAWAGGGVAAAGAERALQDLVERVGMPVITTLEGRGSLPEDHPLCLGANSDMGTMVPVIREADVVLAVGTRFQQATPIHRELTIPGKLVHVDVDPGVIGRVHREHAAVVGDARLALEGLVERVERDRVDVDTAFVERAQAARSAVEAEIWASVGPDHERIVKTMRDLLPREAVVVKDATIPAYLWGNRVLQVLEPRTSIRPASMAIGPGLPLAIGAAVGSGRRVALVQGDGGLMLSVGELATAVEQRLPIVVCVFNDGGYGVIRYMQDQMLEGRRLGVDLVTPDFAALAATVGMPAARVASAEEFAEAFERAVATDGPMLLDIDLTALHPIELRPQRVPAE